MSESLVNIFLIVAMASTLSLRLSVMARPPTTDKPPTVIVSRDGRALEIQRDSDRAPVRVPVLDQCGDPAIGAPKITQIEREERYVSVRYGKHCWAKVDLKTLAIDCVGCD